MGTSSRAGANQLPPTSSLAVLAGRRRQAQLRRRSTALGVIAPEAGGRRGDEQVVATTAESERSRSRAVDRDHLEPAEQRARLRTVRQRAADDHQLAGDRVGHAEGALHGAHRGVERVDVAGDAHRRPRHVHEPPDRTGHVDGEREHAERPLAVRRAALGHRGRPGPAGGDRHGLGRGSGMRPARLVEQQAEQADAAEPVGDDVVGAEVDRRLAAFEALDHGDVPWRALRVERDDLEQGDEVEQLAGGTGRGDAEVAHVGVDGAGLVLHPRRPGPQCRRVVGSAAQPWRHLHGSGEPFDEVRHLRRAVQQHDRAQGHPQGGVLTDPPHDCFQRAQLFGHGGSLARAPTHPAHQRRWRNDGGLSSTRWLTTVVAAPSVLNTSVE